jgi:hypothetical protein
MSRTDADRLSWYILGLGAVLVCTVFALSGGGDPVRATVSASVGVVVALANWFLLRYIIGRVFDGNVRRQAAFSFVLFVKLGGLIALVFFLLRSGLVLPIPFTVGVSSMALGVLLGAFVHILQPSVAKGQG